MDISKASNFERFVFDLLGRDGAREGAVRRGPAARRALRPERRRRLPAGARRYGFVSGKSTHADRLATIRAVQAALGLTIDTHTADGVKVAREHLQPGVPMIVLETALPIKFAATIEEALGHRPSGRRPSRASSSCPRVRVLPADAARVKQLIAQECE
jgi:threonine synthase